MRGVWMLCALTVVAAAEVVAQNAKVSSYVGVYRDAPGDYIVIAPLLPGDPPTLLLAETRTEHLRLLAPAGTDTFTTGPTLTQPGPVERTLHFTSSSRTNRTLTIRTAGSPSSISYPPIPLRVEEVAFRNGDVTLHGTLFIPAERKHRSAIVLAHGSEQNDRNSFGPLPWVLAGHGYVVLAYDKRGTGSSSGKWQPAGIEPLAQDLAAAVDYVARRRDLAPPRIAVLGTSEGGWVAANASRRTPRINAIVAISGGARTKGDAYIYKHRRLAMEAGLQGQQLDSAVAAAALTIEESRRRMAHDSATISGFDRRVTYDPTEDWRTYRGAFLYLGGAVDVLEDAVEAGKWFEQLFRAANHPDYTIKVMPEGHHSLVRAIDGTPSEFAKWTRLRELVPGYWSVLLRWLDTRLYDTAR